MSHGGRWGGGGGRRRGGGEEEGRWGGSGEGRRRGGDGRVCKDIFHDSGNSFHGYTLTLLQHNLHLSFPKRQHRCPPSVQCFYRHLHAGAPVFCQDHAPAHPGPDDPPSALPAVDSAVRRPCALKHVFETIRLMFSHFCPAPVRREYDFRLERQSGRCR